MKSARVARKIFLIERVVYEFYFSKIKKQISIKALFKAFLILSMLFSCQAFSKNKSSLYKIRQTSFPKVGAKDIEIQFLRSKETKLEHNHENGLIKITLSGADNLKLLDSDLDQKFLSINLNCPEIKAKYPIFEKVSISKEQNISQRIQLFLKINPKLTSLYSSFSQENGVITLSAHSRRFKKKTLFEQGILFTA